MVKKFIKAGGHQLALEMQNAFFVLTDCFTKIILFDI